MCYVVPFAGPHRTLVPVFTRSTELNADETAQAAVQQNHDLQKAASRNRCPSGMPSGQQTSWLHRRAHPNVLAHLFGVPLHPFDLVKEYVSTQAHPGVETPNTAKMTFSRLISTTVTLCCTRSPVSTTLHVPWSEAGE
ncbi:hypothetical protein MTO96_040623 [Rhipicephalus appendiculatus]